MNKGPASLKATVAVLVALAISTGCSTVDGVGVYRIESIGNAQRSVEAVVIASRPVRIQTTNSGAGATAGGIAGGFVSANNSDNAAVIIAGVIGGMIVGAAIEGASNVHSGTEYVIKTSNDVVLTVAQLDEGNVQLPLGSRVFLIYGFPCRLIKDPRPSRSSP